MRTCLPGSAGSVGLGAIAGAMIVGWIYVDAYLQQPAFPEEHLLNSLIPRDPSGWRSPLDVVRALWSFDTMRPFGLVFALALVAWIPWFPIERKDPVVLAYGSARCRCSPAGARRRRA